MTTSVMLGVDLMQGELRPLWFKYSHATSFPIVYYKL